MLHFGAPVPEVEGQEQYMLELIRLRFPFRATGPKIQNNLNRSKVGFQAIQKNWG